MLSDGSITKLAPPDIAFSDAVAVAHPRADFSALITELLVCLYQTLAAPATPAARLALGKPGAALDLSGFARAAPQFELFGEGARFLQSPVSLGNPIPTSGLLFEAPGEKTRKLNKDFFFGRADVQAICPDCAPALLMLNQAHARTGGAGYCTSLRGGSAMTAFLQGDTLWETIRLNLLSTEVFLSQFGVADAPENTFPWEHEALFTTAGSATPARIGAYASLWWTPLAVRLSAVPNEHQRACSLCGEVHDHVLAETMQKAATASKAPDGMRHPHTAWTEKAESAQLLPVMVPRGGHLLREWLALNLGGTKPGTALPALAGLGKADARNARIWTFGPSCDKATFSRWHDELVPALLHDSLTPSELRPIAQDLLAEAQRAIKCLAKALSQRKRPARSVELRQSQAQTISALMLACREHLGVALSQVDAESGALPVSVDDAFRGEVRRETLAQFDAAAVLDSADVDGLSYTLKTRADLRKQLYPRTPASKTTSAKK